LELLKEYVVPLEVTVGKARFKREPGMSKFV